jgi:hypothetical protein
MTHTHHKSHNPASQGNLHAYVPQKKCRAKPGNAGSRLAQESFFQPVAASLVLGILLGSLRDMFSKIVLVCRPERNCAKGELDYSAANLRTFPWV